jgi:transcriptional regulator with GAF, ATPase, and Fis domain
MRQPPSDGSEDQRRQWFCDIALEVEDLSRSSWGEDRLVTIVGQSPEIREALRRVAKVAPFEEPVLISGESGVGKEALAQAIFLLGKRRSEPFVTVNCPQFQEGNLTVSELFGHKKGSFTGAIADRKGCFEVADGGVIFLDEIGDLHLSAQTMLLRALATGRFQPLGSSEVRQVNVRVVAASNRPLSELRVGSRFRDDLFFRLRYFHINLPPLRERGDDWLLLAQFFLHQLRRHYGIAKQYSKDSLKILASYDWPGNVRELSSIVTMGYAMADGELIRPRDFASLLDEIKLPSQSLEEDLLSRMIKGNANFWEAVHGPFLNRDLNRSQVRALIRRGLRRSGDSYRGLVETLGLPDTDYQKLMDFLRHHRLKP